MSSAAKTDLSQKPSLHSHNSMRLGSDISQAKTFDDIAFES